MCFVPCVCVQVSVLNRHEEDEFLLLASDGLWDVMANQVRDRLYVCMKLALLLLIRSWPGMFYWASCRRQLPWRYLTTVCCCLVPRLLGSYKPHSALLQACAG